MCVRFGPTRPFVPVPCIVWHWVHTLVVNICCPRAVIASVGCRRCFSLGVQPRVEFFGRFGNDGEAHLCVLVAAEFGTLSPIRSRFVGLKIKRRRIGRDKVFFAVHVRHPEAVNDVVRFEHHLHRASDGDVDLVGGHDVVARRFFVLILDLPPPLMAGDLDGDAQAGPAKGN